MTAFAPTYKHSCPECSTEIELVAVPEWLLTEFKGIMARVLAALLKGRREHKLVTMRELCSAAWPGRWADVPDDAANVVRATIVRYRGRLNYLGWDIAMPQRTGKEGYFLVAITPKGEFDKPIGAYRMSHLVTKKRKKRKKKRADEALQV